MKTGMEKLAYLSERRWRRTGGGEDGRKGGREVGGQEDAEQPEVLVQDNNFRGVTPKGHAYYTSILHACCMRAAPLAWVLYACCTSCMSAVCVLHLLHECCASTCVLCVYMRAARLHVCCTSCMSAARLHECCASTCVLRVHMRAAPPALVLTQKYFNHTQHTTHTHYTHTHDTPHIHTTPTHATHNTYTLHPHTRHTTIIPPHTRVVSNADTITGVC